jgi:hypothetical protein
MQTKNPAFAAKAWSGVTGMQGRPRDAAPGGPARGNEAIEVAGPPRPRGPRYATVRVEGPEVVTPIDEVPNLSTNGTAQGSLELIEVLEMCGDRMP